MDELDFIAEHPKADMSGVDRIRVNWKVYTAVDRVLGIIDEKHDDFRDGSFRDNSITYA